MRQGHGVGAGQVVRVDEVLRSKVKRVRGEGREQQVCRTCSSIRPPLRSEARQGTTARPQQGNLAGGQHWLHRPGGNNTHDAGARAG